MCTSVKQYLNSVSYNINLFFNSTCSGETEDTFIADLSVGLATVSVLTCYLFLQLNFCLIISFYKKIGTVTVKLLFLEQGQIKTGAPCRSERLAKYNQVPPPPFSLELYIL
jgi:enolase